MKINNIVGIRTLDRYLLRQFFPMFIIAVSLFVFLLLLIDLFSNLVRYLNNEVPITVILQISLYFIPKSISYAMPISLLFAAAYTLGDLYARNELTTVFSSGIPFRRFSVSLIVVGFAASIFSFFFEDVLVIPTLKAKNELTRRALRQHVTESNSDIVIRAKNGRIIYAIDFFDFDNQIINGINILEKDEDGHFVSQIRAFSAQWEETHWVFRNAVIYEYEGDYLRVSPLRDTNYYDEHPDTFRRHSVIVEELNARDAGLLVQDLRAAGLPYSHVQANYYHRFSFAAASLIVMILSISMGGRFRKNILLMSLFTSLSVAVVYYIAEMLSMTMAGLNYIHPFVGAWFPVLFFIAVGILLLRYTKT
ncbi:MAG: LptF/LptG family permease [Treponema sp.]|jgi:lipopolysaccharide export system permease protein|nr:LptF/LptG family permease [Treponema sp.]